MNIGVVNFLQKNIETLNRLIYIHKWYITMLKDSINT